MQPLLFICQPPPINYVVYSEGFSQGVASVAKRVTAANYLNKETHKKGNDGQCVGLRARLLYPWHRRPSHHRSAVCHKCALT